MRTARSGRPWTILVTVVVWLLPVFGVSAAEIGGKPEKVDVVVPYAQPSATFTPIWVAYEAGLFKKYGLNAKLEQLTPQVNAQALLSGDADFYTAGPDLLNARLKGARVKYFGGMMWQHVFQIWGAKEITDIKDLKGKTMAATTPRASTDTATRETLKRNGLTPDRDVKILYLQSIPAVLTALVSGQAAAGALSAPTTARAREAGLRMLADTGKLNIRGTVLTYGAREDYLKNNQNTVYAFLKAMAEAVVLAKRDPAVAKQAIAKYTKTADQKVIDESYEFFAPYWLLDFHVRADAIRTQLGYLDEKEFPQAQNADANEFFDNTFVDNLERSGFFRDIGFPR